MKLLLQKAIIIDPQSRHNGKKRDILIEKGKITQIAASIDDKKATIISAKGLSVSPGWIDTQAQFCDPGLEYKETIVSGSQAALKGGFTRVALLPAPSPKTDTKSGIQYALNHQVYGVQLFPIGTLSEQQEGKQLSEMNDMHRAGAVGFSDYKGNVSTELMVRALEYSRNFNGLIYSFPMDRGVNPGGMVHEGKTSVSMGLKGLSALSEELRLHRDIELVKYTGGRLHVSLISTAGSVQLIRKAKKEKINITCSIAAHQLAFLDTDMSGFDSTLKVLPPFRSVTDRKALIEGLKDGTIDAICSDHCPEDTEHKVLEFEYASFGMSSIQTAFCVALTALEKEMEVTSIIEKFTTGPAKVLNVTLNCIEENATSNITVFSTDETTTFHSNEWASLSKNSPFIGKELRGKVITAHS